MQMCVEANGRRVRTSIIMIGTCVSENTLSSIRNQIVRNSRWHVCDKTTTRTVSRQQQQTNRIQREDSRSDFFVLWRTSTLRLTLTLTHESLDLIEIRVLWRNFCLPSGAQRIWKIMKYIMRVKVEAFLHASLSAARNLSERYLFAREKDARGNEGVQNTRQHDWRWFLRSLIYASRVQYTRRLLRAFSGTRNQNECV
jgi:hypothetical protein